MLNFFFLFICRKLFAFCFHQKNYPRIFFFVRKDKTGFDILTARRQIQRCFSLQSLSRPGFSPLIFRSLPERGFVAERDSALSCLSRLHARTTDLTVQSCPRIPHRGPFRGCTSYSQGLCVGIVGEKRWLSTQNASSPNSTAPLVRNVWHHLYSNIAK